MMSRTSTITGNLSPDNMSIPLAFLEVGRTFHPLLESV